MELARGRVLATPRRRSSVVGGLPSARRKKHLGGGRAAFGVGGLGLLALLGVFALTLSRPDAPVESLFLPLAVLMTVATGAAASVGLLLRQSEPRSINLLHRGTRRILNGDTLGFVAPSVSPSFQALANDLGELASEFERLRADLERTARELRLALQGREHLVNTLAIENKRLRVEASVVHEFVETVNRPLDREQVCLQLLNALDDEITYREALIYLVDPGTDLLRPAAVCDRDQNFRHVGRYVQSLPNFAGEPISGRGLAAVVFQTGKAIVVTDARTDGRFSSLRTELRSYLAVPIEVKSRTIGVLQLGTTEPTVYDDHDERRLSTLARYAAVWIENVRLFEEAAKVEALRKVDRLKSELLSTVSHELRTPLASIKGYATSLLRTDVEWDDATRREFLQIIDEESDRLTGLIADLLEMSEIEAGMLRVEKEPVLVPRLVQKVVKKLRPGTGDHSISFSAAADLPETMGDPRRLEQVLHNLVANAIKYSPVGTPISVRVERVNHDLLVSVKDQGVGIAPEH
ncbi:MAG: histidine kinase dimerization/phospho-acceptor domain-containing protein, partial [Chloroflexota bacterium]